MTIATAEPRVAGHSQVDSDSELGSVEPSYDDINMPVILMVGVISAIVTLCTIFFVQGLCYQWQNSYVRDRSLDFVNEPVREVVESQKALLNGGQEGIKSIDESMDAMVKKYGKQSSK